MFICHLLGLYAFLLCAGGLYFLICSVSGVQWETDQFNAQIDNPLPHGGCNMIRNVLSYECAFIDIIICQNAGRKSVSRILRKKIEQAKETQKKTASKTISHEMRQNEWRRQKKKTQKERMTKSDSQLVGARDWQRQTGDFKSKLSNHCLLLYLTRYANPVSLCWYEFNSMASVYVCVDQKRPSSPFFHHASLYSISALPVQDDTVIITLQWKSAYNLPRRHSAKCVFKQRVHTSVVFVENMNTRLCLSGGK